MSAVTYAARMILQHKHEQPSQAFLDALTEACVEGSLLTRNDDLSGYSRDEFADESIAQIPFAVARPSTTEEISRIASLCSEHGVPLTVRGGGTGLSGGCVPAAGGIVLSTERLRQIGKIDSVNQTITVGAGVPLSDLYEAVEASGLFFPPHPGDEQAAIGGAVATNAGGSRAVKYGTIRDFVLGIETVLPDGAILRLGGAIRKATCGYDLKDLVIGSEGTLGIITGVTLRLMSPPGYTLTLVAPFLTVSSAIASVPAVLAAGITPMAVEFIEHETVRCAERLLDKSWPTTQGSASCMFVLDAEGEDEAFALAEKVAGVLEAGEAIDVLVATDQAQQRSILELRSTVYEALKPATAELLDVCVPRSEIAGHVAYIASLEDETGHALPTYGHAADGNVHTHLLTHNLIDGEIGDEIPGWSELQAGIRTRIYRDAVSRGGVISGEHGIGQTKRDDLSRYLPAEELSIMRRIKYAFDPAGILNPGKVLPEEGSA